MIAQSAKALVRGWRRLIARPHLPDQKFVAETPALARRLCLPLCCKWTQNKHREYEWLDLEPAWAEWFECSWRADLYNLVAIDADTWRATCALKPAHELLKRFFKRAFNSHGH